MKKVTHNPPEVKRENLSQTQNEVKYPWKPTPGKVRPAWIGVMNQEESVAILRGIGEITYFPFLQYTSLDEAARFFGIPDEQRDRFRTHVMNAHFQVNADCPVKPGPSIVAECRRRAQVAGQAEMLQISTVSGLYGDMTYLGLSGDEPTKALRLGTPKGSSKVRLISPRGMICIAHRLMSRKNNQFAKDVAKQVVLACEAAGYTNYRRHHTDITIPESEVSIMPNPMPSNPITEPKLDPAQTLRQMFDAMLNLLDKQAEERGAEKIIQRLKEEGKL